MELRQYITILRRRKWIVLGTMILSIGLIALYNYLATPMYTSSSTVRIATIGSGVIGGYTDNIYSERLMNTYARLVTGGAATSEIVAELGLTERPEVTVEVVPNTELLRITAEVSDPFMAQEVARLSAENLIERNRQLYASEGQTAQEILRNQIMQLEQELVQLRNDYDSLVLAGSDDSPAAEAAGQALQLREQTYASLLDQYEQVRLNEALRANTVTLVDPAYLPDAPSKPRSTLNLLLAALLGLMAGVALALAVDNLDTKLYTSGQIASATQLPILGRVPAAKGQSQLVSLTDTTLPVPLQEAFRRLRVSLLALPSQPRSIMVTSAEVGEGKSTIAANLALSFAKSGRTVVLVDCDLHMPAQHRLFGLSNERGLSSLLMKQVSVEGATQQTPLPTLHIISSGPGLPHPGDLPGVQLTPAGLSNQLMQGTELLGTPQMAVLLNQLSENYDIVLLDTPALLTITDAAVLAPLVDSVLLVVASERSRRDALYAVREQLSSVSVESINVVINYDHQQSKHYVRRAAVRA